MTSVSYRGTVSLPSSSSTIYLFEDVDIGTPADDRVIVCIAVDSIGSSGCNIDSQAMDSVVDSVTGKIFALPFPSGSTADIELVYGSALSRAHTIAIYALYGVDHEALDTASSTSASASVDVDTEIDSILIVSSIRSPIVNAPTLSGLVGVTQDEFITLTGSHRAVVASHLSSSIEEPRTVTVTWTGGIGGSQNTIAASFSPAAAADACTFSFAGTSSVDFTSEVINSISASGTSSVSFLGSSTADTVVSIEGHSTTTFPQVIFETDWIFPTRGRIIEADGAGETWDNNADRITADDEVACGKVGNTWGNGAYTDYLLGDQFDTSFPFDPDELVGIAVRIRIRSSITSTLSGSLTIYNVNIGLDDTTQGTLKEVNTVLVDGEGTLPFTDFIYGGYDDLWGLDATLADVQDPDFQAFFNVRCVGGNITLSNVAVDSISVKFYFSYSGDTVKQGSLSSNGLGAAALTLNAYASFDVDISGITSTLFSSEASAPGIFSSNNQASVSFGLAATVDTNLTTEGDAVASYISEASAVLTLISDGNAEASFVSAAEKEALISSASIASVNIEVQASAQTVFFFEGVSSVNVSTSSIHSAIISIDGTATVFLTVLSSGEAIASFQGDAASAFAFETTNDVDILSEGISIINFIGTGQEAVPMSSAGMATVDFRSHFIPAQSSAFIIG